VPDGRKQRSILVTRSGIGRAIARLLAAPGVGMTIHARTNRSGCEHAKREVEARGGEALIVLATWPMAPSHATSSTARPRLSAVSTC
jgi:NAD(P)-dependent dehydrogenase (short-subunit alcohol dehydrogenase family)